MFMGSVMLSICSSSCVLYSTGSGVKRVLVVLSGLRMRLFVRVHVCILCRYDWMFVLAMFMSLCVDAYPSEVTFIWNLSYTLHSLITVVRKCKYRNIICLILFIIVRCTSINSA